MYQSHDGGTATSIVLGEKLTCRTSYTDGVELAEEYDIRTGDLNVRRWKQKGALGSTEETEFDNGGAEARTVVAESGAGPAAGGVLMAESSAAPTIARRNLRDAWEFRIRNLPWPLETYSLEVEGDELVLRTANKKYFKRLNVPALIRAGTLPQRGWVSLAHASSTLVISVRKPSAIVRKEAAVRARVLEEAAKRRDGDVACKTQ
jgi:hypothetical protein